MGRRIGIISPRIPRSAVLNNTNLAYAFGSFLLSFMLNVYREGALSAGRGYSVMLPGGAVALGSFRTNSKQEMSAQAANTQEVRPELWLDASRLRHSSMRIQLCLPKPAGCCSGQI